MSTPATTPPVFSSALQQLSSLLSLSQEIRTRADSGQPLSTPDLISKLDTLLPAPVPSSPGPPGTPTTPHKPPGELMTSADSGLAMTASFSSLYESDESVFSPFSHTKPRRHLGYSRTPPPGRRPHPGPLSRCEEEDLREFLHSVSSEFCSSLRALLTLRNNEVRQEEMTASASDVTLPELELGEKERDTMDQLRERNAFLVTACRELKTKVRAERREGRRVREENTSLSLEREGVLAKMSETEKEIIEKMSQHAALMEAYAELQRRVKERERSVREAHNQIAAMEVEVSKLSSLLSRVEQKLSESRLREEDKQRETSHLQEQLVMKEREKEVLELKYAAERVQSHARLLSSMRDSTPPPAPDTYTVGLVSTDRILEEATSLCEQLNQLTELFTDPPSHTLSQIRSGLSHALADSNLLLNNVTALKSEHERCKDALFQLQMEEKGYDVPSDPEGGVDLLTRIAGIVPRIKLDAELLAEQWDGVEVSNAADNNILSSRLRAILSEHMSGEVPEPLLTSLSSLLSPRQRGTSAPSPGGASPGLEGMLKESSLLLSSMSEALTSEQLKRHSQVRALKRRAQRDCSALRRVQVECERARRGERSLRRALSSLLDNLSQAEQCELRLTDGVTEESVREVAERIERVLLVGCNKKVSSLKERLVSAVKNWEQTRKVLEGSLSDNESLGAEVREVHMSRVRLEGDKRGLEREVDRLRQVLRGEREESQTRESLLSTKLSIVQEHIEQYDTVMFEELKRLSDQVRSDKLEKQKVHEKKEEGGQGLVLGLRQQLAEQGEHVNYLERELTICKVKLLDCEDKAKQVEELSTDSEDLSVKEESEKKLHFSQELPAPSPYSLPPVAPLRGEELQVALGVALSQEKLYARAHLSLQTERDQLAEENRRLTNKLNSVHQHISDPLGLIPSRHSPSPSAPIRQQDQGYSASENRLELEKASLTTQLIEANSKLARLENYRILHFESKNKIKSLVWQKSYLKSQLNVYFSSLRASALILSDLGVGADGIGSRSSSSGRSKFRVIVWVVIFIHRLANYPRTQPSFTYSDYGPSSGHYPLF